MLFIETVSAASTSNAAEESTGLLANIMGMIPLIISAIAVLIVSFILAKFIKGIVMLRLSKKDLNREVLILVGRMTTYGIVFLGLLAATQIVGLNFGSLIAFLGVGIGFALKDLLSNFIAGIMILTQKKFKIGDAIKTGDIVGKIIEIETRTTQIKSFDGTLLIIPNAQMVNAVVENFSANEMRRIKFDVGVGYNTPLQESIQLAIASVKKHQKIMPEPGTNVVATEFGDSAINLCVFFWVESDAPWVQIKSEVIQQLKIDFDAADIEIPFPIRTIALESNDDNLMQAMNLPKKEVRKQSVVAPPVIEPVQQVPISPQVAQEPVVQQQVQVVPGTV
jgi:small conductance mechanosensitive channel